MGYSGESGRALKAISALIKFGFLEKSGADGLKVSERAMAILYPENEDDKLHALHAAANEPALFEQIFKRWDNARPTEESLVAYLIRRGYNVNSLQGVTRAFYDTYDLVSEHGGSYDSGGSSEPAADADDKTEDQTVQETHQSAGGGSSVVREKAKERTPEQSATVNATYPVFDFKTVRVNTVIDNRDDLAELMARLEQIKSMLPPKVQH
jgi:hypothetical protein